MCRLLVNLTLFWTVYGVRYSDVLVCINLLDKYEISIWEKKNAKTVKNK